MNIKRYFSARILVHLCMLSFVCFMCLVLLWITDPRPLPAGRLILLASLSILYILILVAFYLWIVKPYQNVQQTQKMFVKDQLYDELLQLPLALSPEYEQVVEHFYQMLRKQDTVELTKKQAEYLALQNQINPHFLYNTLEAIRGDALMEGALAIAQTTEALATFFRYTISETDALVTITDELENVGNYFSIQEYRFGNKLHLRIVFEDDEALIRKYQIPKLTLQPIVENAIHHGLEKKVEGGTVSIILQVTQKRLLINIADNGVGMQQKDVDRVNRRLEKTALSYIIDDKNGHGGIALRNVAQRIKLLFGEQYGVRVFSIAAIGTEVHITLPKLQK